MTATRPMRLPARPAYHLCPVAGCHVQVIHSRLMCPDHWRCVPSSLQRRVWRAYLAGMRDQKHPTDQYGDLAREAIALAEGHRAARPPPAMTPAEVFTPLARKAGYR